MMARASSSAGVDGIHLARKGPAGYGRPFPQIGSHQTPFPKELNRVEERRPLISRSWSG